MINIENFREMFIRMIHAPIETWAVYYIYCRLFWENKVRIISYYYKSQLVYKYGIYMGANCKVGRNLMLPHPQGIVIGDKTVIGDNCIGSGCVIYPGAKVIGRIYIRKNTTVAAQAVVRTSTEINSTYAGVPARKI